MGRTSREERVKKSKKSEQNYETLVIENSILKHITEDIDGNTVNGIFEFNWDASSNREGDYFIFINGCCHNLSILSQAKQKTHLIKGGS